MNTPVNPWVALVVVLVIMGSAALIMRGLWGGK